jgi:hypothetical protein
MGNHEITIGDASVTFEQVEVELDYSDILENIEDTIASRVSDQIGDEAWDAVRYQVDDAVTECFDNYEPDVDVTDGIRSLLGEFNDTQEPCSLGEEFIGAVRKALAWDGARFKEEAPFSLTLDYGWVQEAIAKEIKVQLKGIVRRLIDGESPELATDLLPPQ